VQENSSAIRSFIDWTRDDYKRRDEKTGDEGTRDKGTRGQEDEGTGQWGANRIATKTAERSNGEEVQHWS